MKAVVLDSQSLFDLAIQSLGDISGTFDLAEPAGVSITDSLAAGQALQVPPRAADRQVRDYYASRRLTPATAITIESTSGDGNLLPEGVGLWGIEHDFMVSGENGAVN